MKRYLVFLVLLIGILLRWYGIDWSLPLMFHPDETRLLYAVQDISWEDPNPHFFAYGSLPIYLLKITQVSAEAVAKFLGRPPHVNFFLMGRVVSALFGSLTLIVLYLLGKRFFSDLVGLLATAFLAFTVLHIQLCHFLTVDVMMTFFVVLTFYFLASLAEGKHPLRDYLLSGIIIGGALATKISALPLYGVFFFAHIFAWTHYRGRISFPKRRSTLFFWGSFMLALVLSCIAFFICEPYAFLDFHEFYRQVKEQSDMVRGLTQPPFVIQYEQTTRYLYQIQQLIDYSMGFPLGLLTLFGTLFVFISTIRQLKTNFIQRTLDLVTCPLHLAPRSLKVVLLMLLWVIPVFWIVGGFKVKFLRYMLPLIPFFCLLGAIFVEYLLQRCPSWKKVVYALVVLTIAFSAFYAVAFVSIYHHEDPRKAASRWIYAHIEKGRTLLTEAWEFAPLVPVDGHYPGQYLHRELHLYDEPDTDQKMMNIAQHLAKSDIIVLATRRLYGSILRVPERYPLTSNYYKLLFDGKLGFKPVKTFTLYPSLFGITFKDDFADESFSVYDHPKTIIFRKTEKFSEEALFLMLISKATFNPEAQLKRLLAFPALEQNYTPLAQKEKGASTFLPAHWKATVIWLLTVEALALSALPLTVLIFRKLPDSGYALSKATGILLPSYLLWLLVSLKLFSHSRATIFVLLDILLLCSFLIVLKYQSFFRERFLTHWKVFLIHESVFLLAFAAFLLFRAYNPDIFWSESAMDFSFLNVLVRTETLPPPDPWISGFTLNYYYFGHYIVATLTRLTGIAPQVTYNLAFALVPALVIVEIFSLLYNLTQRYFYGAVGVLFSSIIGNLDGFFLLIANWRRQSRLVNVVIREIPVIDNLIGTESYYRFFRPAHEVIPYTVHEFPFWTFIFVDLHAHLLNMPFLIAVLLVGLNILSEESKSEFQSSNVSSSPFLTSLTLFLYTLLIGTLGVISSWDYPTAVIFLFLIVVTRTYRNFQKIQPFLHRIRTLLFLIWIIIPGSFILYAPFFDSFSRSGMGIGLAGTSVTYILDFLTIFGFFFFLILSYFIVQAVRLHHNAHPWLTTLICLTGVYIPFFIALNYFDYNYATFFFAIFTIILGSYIFFISLSANFSLSETSTTHLYIWLCLIYAGMIVAGCELIFVRDFLQGGQEYLLADTAWETYIPKWFLTFYTGDYKRMNTIFKFYIPAWLLLSFVATYCVSQILPVLKCHFTRRRVGRGYRRHVGRGYRILSHLLCGFWIACFGFLLLCSAIFPVLATYARRHHQDLYNRTYVPPTLDGLAFLYEIDRDEYQAIHWLNTHVGGTPVILEATGDDYRYEYARISANTGLPTVLGWRSHAEQREHWEDAHQRVEDIRTIYTNANIKQVLRLLRRYEVEYLYIGATERKDFAPTELRKFEEYPQYFEPAFRSGETAIYRVVHQES